MFLKEKIQQDLREAQLGKDEISVSTLRMLLAAINNKEIEKWTKLAKSGKTEKLQEQLADEEVSEVVSSEAKKRKEAVAAFEKGNRQDLAEKEKKELKILEKYLPEQMSEEEIKDLVQKAIEATEATNVKDIGKVMQELMPKVKGRADGNLIGKIVRELLS